MHVSRWERRRARKNKSNRRPSFDIFDLVLLSLIFTISVVLFKFLSVYAIITMPCADYAANFGAGYSSPPAFKMMFYISILMLGFWLILIIFDPNRRNSIFGLLWQFVLLLCILLSGYHTYHMSIWDKPAFPDGTLAVADGVWGTKNGERVWANIPLNPMLFEYLDGTKRYEQEYRKQRCVWLKDGLISVGDNPFVGDLEVFIEKTKQRWVTDERIPFGQPLEWPDISVVNYIDKVFSRESQIETLRNNTEFLRPLTDAERDRFLVKQKCLKALTYDPSNNTHPRPYSALIEQCDPQLYLPWPTD